MRTKWVSGKSGYSVQRWTKYTKQIRSTIHGCRFTAVWSCMPVILYFEKMAFKDCQQVSDHHFTIRLFMHMTRVSISSGRCLECKNIIDHCLKIRWKFGHLRRKPVFSLLWNWRISWIPDRYFCCKHHELIEETLLHVPMSKSKNSQKQLVSLKLLVSQKSWFRVWLRNLMDWHNYYSKSPTGQLINAFEMIMYCSYVK